MFTDVLCDFHQGLMQIGGTLFRGPHFSEGYSEHPMYHSGSLACRSQLTPVQTKEDLASKLPANHLANSQVHKPGQPCVTPKCEPSNQHWYFF